MRTASGQPLLDDAVSTDELKGESLQPIGWFRQQRAGSTSSGYVQWAT
jgi:hypothetical protein